MVNCKEKNSSVKKALSFRCKDDEIHIFDRRGMHLGKISYLEGDYIYALRSSNGVFTRSMLLEVVEKMDELLKEG